MMNVSHLSSMNHTYEDIEGQLMLSQKKSNSDTDLLRLCGQELEIINNLIKDHKRPLVQQQNEVTFSLYEQIEQGFYKCHDSIYDVPEGQRIPDLMKKRPATTTKVKDAETIADTQTTTRLMLTADAKQCSKRRLSLDSGHGTSVADEDTQSHLDTSFSSSSMPSLCHGNLGQLAKANDQHAAEQDFEEMNMSDALDRICGTSSLESLPGYRKCLATPPPGYRNSPTTPSPPPLPPRGNNVGPPVPPSSSTKNETRTVKEFPKGQQLNSKGTKQQLDNNKRKLFKNPLKHKKARLTPCKLTPVKLLLSSPFCRTKQRQNLGGVASTPQPTLIGGSTTVKTVPQNEKNSVTSSEKRRLNLESLNEAQIYGLPIIPFPYSEQKSRQKTEGNSGSLIFNTNTPLNNHYHGNQKRLIAATDIRPSRKMNHRQLHPVPNANIPINRRLHFDQEDCSPLTRFDVEDNFPTPLIVKALSTPAGIRRRLKPFETPLTHCKSCTCDKTIVSRREMLTSIDLDSSYSLKFGQEPQIQRNVPNLETPSRNSTKPQQTEVSEALQNNNYQEDYVKMSAKLV